MKAAVKVGLGLLAVAILLVLAGTFYTLEEGQQAVIVQFGRPVGTPVTDAGLHLKLPFVQDVRRFEKRLLIWDGDPNQIPTKGREFIWVDTTARWRIADAKKFLENVATEAGARSRLDDIIDSVVRDQVSASELVELVRSASWEVPEGEVLEEVPAEVREELKKEVTRGREELTRTILAEARKVIPQYGIELVDVRIKRLNYVESVREKVYARMISERKRIAARFRSEGEGRSAEILGTMEKELRQIRSTAYRRAQEIRGKADAEATQIYGRAYNRNPEFYAFSRTLEAYKEGQNKNPVPGWLHAIGRCARGARLRSRFARPATTRGRRPAASAPAVRPPSAARRRSASSWTVARSDTRTVVEQCDGMTFVAVQSAAPGAGANRRPSGEKVLISVSRHPHLRLAL